MKRMRRFAGFALPMVLYAASIGPARSADALLPGTYNQISPATKRVMSVGNELVLQADRRGRLQFSLNAIRPLDKNMGYIGGTLPRNGGTIVWTNTQEFARCRLTFSFAPPLLKVTQDIRFGDCGFGYGVSGDGSYRRTRTSGKLGSWNGP